MAIQHCPNALPFGGEIKADPFQYRPMIWKFEAGPLPIVPAATEYIVALPPVIHVPPPLSQMVIFRQLFGNGVANEVRADAVTPVQFVMVSVPH